MGPQCCDPLFSGLPLSQGPLKTVPTFSHSDGRTVGSGHLLGPRSEAGAEAQGGLALPAPRLPLSRLGALPCDQSVCPVVWGCVAGCPSWRLCQLMCAGERPHVLCILRAGVSVWEGEGLRLGGPGRPLEPLFCLPPPPSFLPLLGGGMNEVLIWFLQSWGLAHTQVCYGIHSPPRG